MFVVGCHRSGTSYVSGFLSDVVGCLRPNDLDRTVDNPRGYFESTLLRPFNDQLLSAAGYTWDRPPLAPVHWSQGRYLLQAIQRKSDFEGYALTDSWVDKDPRLALTRPLYEHLLLKRVPCVFVIRHPLDVARSLWLRDGFSPEKGLLIWFLYNRACSLGYQHDVDQLISYESLLSGDPSQFFRLRQFLSLSSSTSDSQYSELDERILQAHRKHTDHSLRRNHATADRDFILSSGGFSSILRDHCCNIFDSLVDTRFSASEFVNQFLSLPTALVDNYDRILSDGSPSLEFLRTHQLCAPEPQAPGLSSELSTGQYGQDKDLISDYVSLLNVVHKFRQEGASAAPCDLELLQSQLDAIQASSSWRLTAPLRYLFDQLKHFSPWR